MNEISLSFSFSNLIKSAHTSIPRREQCRQMHRYKKLATITTITTAVLLTAVVLVLQQQQLQLLMVSNYVIFDTFFSCSLEPIATTCSVPW